MDNSYKLIEQMILQEMEYKGSRQKENVEKSKQEVLDRRIKEFEKYMNKIFTFDLTQRVGKETGGASQREYGQLLLSGLGQMGTSYEDKLKNLENMLNSNSSVTNVSSLFSGLTVAKMMHTLLYDMNQRKAGNAFEVFMAVLMDGSIEETYGQTGGDQKEDFDIIDITAPAKNGRDRYSLKFVSAGAYALKGSLFNTMNEITQYGSVNYIYCVKNKQKRDKISLTFKKFTIDKETFKKINIGYLRKYKFLELFDAGKIIPDSNQIQLGAKQTVSTSLSNFDIVDVATLNIGLDNIRNLLENSKSAYINLLLATLENLNNTTEQLARFIYTDNVESGEKAKQGAEKLSSSIGSALSIRTDKGDRNAK